jgi:FSR family fosmidomycin resistance protein-like MFS transporter
MLLVAASLIGVGSSTFHPEASRVARLASGGRFGTAQSTFRWAATPARPSAR